MGMRRNVVSHPPKTTCVKNQQQNEKDMNHFSEEEEGIRETNARIFLFKGQF